MVTNILLDRANENPEAAGRAFDGLAETGDIALLLDPEHEYIPDDTTGSPAGDRVERQNEIGEWVVVELDDVAEVKAITIATP